MITTMLDLLALLYDDPFDHRKTGAYVECYQPGEARVKEYFDDGKGHSGAFTSKATPLEWGVFTEAREKGYITGLLKPGYVSTCEFKLSQIGNQEYVIHITAIVSEAQLK